MTPNPPAGIDPEIVAINAVYAALRDLEPDAQVRVLRYIAAKLGIDAPTSEGDRSSRNTRSETPMPGTEELPEETEKEAEGEFEGISRVAKKWMARNGLAPHQLSRIFSLGSDEIDLIAETVPGKKKTDRMHNVFLLKGVAAYLGTGAARFTHDAMKEACLHYDAYDAANFAVNFKRLSSEVSGSREAGYTLTPRGLARATDVLKSMIQ